MIIHLITSNMHFVISEQHPYIYMEKSTSASHSNRNYKQAMHEPVSPKVFLKDTDIQSCAYLMI